MVEEDIIVMVVVRVVEDEPPVPDDVEVAEVEVPLKLLEVEELLIEEFDVLVLLPLLELVLRLPLVDNRVEVEAELEVVVVLSIPSSASTADFAIAPTMATLQLLIGASGKPAYRPSGHT